MRLAVHSHYGEELIHSMTVGITHWEELGAGEGELPGPSPTFFFAPDRATKRSEDWGRAELQSRVADAWHPFCEWAGGWLEVVEGRGFEAVQRVYLDVLEGRVEPQDRQRALARRVGGSEHAWPGSSFWAAGCAGCRRG